MLLNRLMVPQITPDTPGYEDIVRRWGGAGGLSYSPEWAPFVSPWDNSMDTRIWDAAALDPTVRRTRREQGQRGRSPVTPNIPATPDVPASGIPAGLKGGGYGQDVFPYPPMSPGTTGIGITGYQTPWTQPLYNLYGTGGTPFDRINQLYAPWNANVLQNNAADYYYAMQTRYSPTVSPLMSYYPTGYVAPFLGFQRYQNPGYLGYDYSSLFPGGQWNWLGGGTGGRI